MKRKLSKAIALVLVLTTAFSLMTMAGAATVKYAKTEVNVRSGPGTNYTVLGYLEKGDAVNATGTVVGNWTQIQYSKYEVGYVYSAYLTGSNSSSSQVCAPSGLKIKVCTDCGDTYYATTALNVRTGPSTSYPVIGELAKNQQVTRVGKSGNWYKLLTTDGSDAYASASYLKLYKTGSACYEEEEEVEARGYYYATTGLNVRKGPGTEYRIVDELERGERVAYLGKSGNWYKVRTGRGIEGYCYKSYLTTSTVKPVKPSYKGYYCNECGVVVCTEDGCYTNGGVCYKDKYYCGSCYNFNWSCYSPVFTNPCGTLYAGETYRTQYGIVLYSKPTTSSPVTHTLLTGTKVTLVSGTGNSNWVYVKVNDCGCYGYLPTQSIG